jgi:hypothetical protein
MNNLRQVHTDESLQCTSMPQPALSLSTQFPLQQRAIRRYKPVPVPVPVRLHRRTLPVINGPRYATATPLMRVSTRARP